MVTNNRTNNRANLEQVCSLNIEQSRLLQFSMTLNLLLIGKLLHHSRATRKTQMVLVKYVHGGQGDKKNMTIGSLINGCDITSSTSP